MKTATRYRPLLKKMKRIHYFSGLTLTLFIGIHLANHFASFWGAESHIEFMEMVRPIYRNVIIETLLLLAVGVQIISGIKLLRTKRKVINGFYEKLQLRTGLYMAFFLLIHVGAVLSGRFILDLDTNFYFGVAGLNTFPFNLFFLPYYGFAILSFFGHIASIHHAKMNTELFGFSVKRQSNLILFTGIVLTLSLMYGLTNGFSGVEIPEEYHILIGK